MGFELLNVSSSLTSKCCTSVNKHNRQLYKNFLFQVSDSSNNILVEKTLLFNLLTIIVGKIRISISIVNKNFPPECFHVIEKGSLLRSGNNDLHLYTGLISWNKLFYSIPNEYTTVFFH